MNDEVGLDFLEDQDIILDFQHVTKEFPGVTALKDVSMQIRRGEIRWAELADPRGSEPGYRRPVLVIQADSFNQSNIGTVVVVAITSNLDLGKAPGNVRLSRKDSRLPRLSVVNVSQVLTLDRRFLTGRVVMLPERIMMDVDAGLRLVMSLD